MDRLELVPVADEPFLWRLERGSALVADVALPQVPGDPVVVAPAEGPSWRLEAYGRGWRLGARREDDDAPLLWYTGWRLRAGGELVLAPERRLSVRSARLRRLDWWVEDEARTRLVEAVARPHRRSCVVEVRPLTGTDPDVELAATFLAVLGLLVWQEGRRQRSLGVDGTGPRGRGVRPRGRQGRPRPPTSR